MLLLFITGKESFPFFFHVFCACLSDWACLVVVVVVVVVAVLVLIFYFPFFFGFVFVFVFLFSSSYFFVRWRYTAFYIPRASWAQAICYSYDDREKKRNK